jgi:cytochrome c553
LHRHAYWIASDLTFPRLAGQHAEYLVKQVVMFKREVRAGANAPIMHAVSRVHLDAEAETWRSSGTLSEGAAAEDRDDRRPDVP